MILIVDNNREAREALRRLLTRVGYRAETVAAGQEALDYLRAVCPRLVILDVSDPMGVGLDVLRAIRQEETLVGMPVVVRTTGHDSKAEQEARRLGVSASRRVVLPPHPRHPPRTRGPIRDASP